MDYAESAASKYFRKSRTYTQRFTLEHISESHQRFGHSERHLQCVWFDPQLRPARLCSADGEPVTIVTPGRWNLESGPDFLDAVLLVGKERRRVCGDVEIHIASKDWVHHGHGRDPRYNKVRFHVTYYADANPPDLPQGTIHIALAEGLQKTPGFHFEDIDLAAYPFNRFGPPTPCSEQFKDLPFETKQALLEAAGQERLRRKTTYIERELATKTREQVFYEQTLYALGFKNNRNAFRTLAGLVPSSQLADMSKENAYALLLGVSNLIPSQIPTEWPAASRDFVRDCWNRWFKLRNDKADLIMSQSNWQLAHLRPLNSPDRRMAAAAAWFAVDNPLLQRVLDLADYAPENFVKEVTRLLTEVSHPFWSYRDRWKSSGTSKPMALIGKGRADAILINVITPMLAALKIDPVFHNGLLERLPLEPSNAIIRETAHRLFDLDHPSALYNTELARQGLIQIFQDHCLCGTPSCDECALPRQIKNLQQQAPHEQ